MAAKSESPKSLWMKLVWVWMVGSCISLMIQTGSARNVDNILGQAQEKTQQQGPKLDECARSFAEASVCLVDIWTNLGRPSAICCQALQKIDEECWPILLPFLNPSVSPFLRGLCSSRVGIGLPLPIPPFLPFPFPGPGTPIAGGLDDGLVPEPAQQPNPEALPPFP